MKRTYALLALAAAFAVGLAAIAYAQSSSSPPARTSRSATVQLRRTHLGSILVSGSGRTLYEFTRDHGTKSSCATISGCSAAWPPLKTSGHPTAGPGVRASLLSTTRGGQVTYAGHPLYTYSGDSGPGETSYVGVRTFGGAWYALSASGGAVR